VSVTRLKWLEVKNFRNYSQLFWECPEGVNVIYGENGAGKSNLLESIFYLAWGRSFRGSTDQQMLRWDSDFFQIRGHFLTFLGDTEISISYCPPRKLFRLNGLPGHLQDFTGLVPVIVFSPQDIALVKGPPEGRRAFLDHLLAAQDSLYCQNLKEYRRILKQRNILLKRIKQGKGGLRELEPWDVKLREKGTALMEKREKGLKALCQLLEPIYSQMEPGKKPSLAYLPNVEADNWEGAMKKARMQELKWGYTLLGPHRDDFSFKIDNKEARFFASQGQQRSMALALKLATLSLWKDHLRRQPLLLLDDVFSELDRRRQEALARLIPPCQTFITSAERETLPPRLLAGASLWNLREGRLRPICP